MYVYKVGFAQQSAEYMIAIDIIFTRAVIWFTHESCYFEIVIRGVSSHLVC